MVSEDGGNRRIVSLTVDGLREENRVLEISRGELVWRSPFALSVNAQSQLNHAELRSTENQDTILGQVIDEVSIPDT